MHIQINHFARIYTTIVSNCLNRRNALWCRISRVRLFLGMLVALMLGLGTHVVMMVWLNIPYPYNPPTHGVLLFVNQVLIVGGSLALYRYAAFDRIFPKILIRTFYFFLLLTTLTEQLIRDAVMNGFVTSAYSYASLEVLPKLVPWLVIAGTLAIFGTLMTTIVRRIVGCALIAAVTYLIVKPVSDGLFAKLLEFFAYLDHPPVYGFPYGWQVTAMAFVTYIEPVTACLVAAWLTFDRLPGRPMRRLLTFASIIITVRGSAFGFLAYAFRHSDHFWGALVSSGQFALESAVLGLLTGLAWHFSRIDPVVSSSPSATQNQKHLASRRS